MDKESILFCGVERLQIDIGVAVAVALDVFVDLVLNDRPKHGAILHVDICLHPPGQETRGRLPSRSRLLLLQGAGFQL